MPAFRRVRIVAAAKALFTIVAVCLAGDSMANDSELPESLFTTGVEVREGHLVPLDLPIVTKNPSPKHLMQRAKAHAKRIGWDRFSRDSIPAPVVIDIDAIKDAQGKLLGHNIRSAFIAYAPLEQLRNQELMQNVFGQQNGEAESESGDSGAGEEVPTEILQQLGIELDEDREALATVTLPLLNKVQVNGVVRVTKGESKRWVTVTWYFDPHFDFGATDGLPPKYTNSWQKLERQKASGSLQAYQGCAGQMTIAQIDAESNMLLIESQTIMREPQEWFRGSAALRSKLPISIQENARSLRRKLKKLATSN